MLRNHFFSEPNPMAILQKLPETVTGETAEKSGVQGSASGTAMVCRGAPPLVAAPGDHPPLAPIPGDDRSPGSGVRAARDATPLVAALGYEALFDPLPGDDQFPGSVAAGGVQRPVALQSPEPPSSSVPTPLYEAAIRFFNAREKWSKSYSATDCIGSRYWEYYQIPDKSIAGINPLDFYGPHPVWEGFAIPIRIKRKVDHFYCTFCKKVFAGDATRAYHHMVKSQGQVCQISRDTREFLVRKERVFSERRLELSSKKGQGNHRIAERACMGADRLLDNLMKELSHHQDCKIMDSASEELVLITTLLDQAEQLLELGSHPTRITEGYEIASKIAINHLECNKEMFGVCADNIEGHTQTCVTTLPPKIANDCKWALADISCSRALEAYASEYPGFEQHAISSFAYALDAVPLSVENDHLPPIDVPCGATARPQPERVTNTTTEHENARILIAKYQEKILFATRVVRMILMICMDGVSGVGREEGNFA